MESFLIRVWRRNDILLMGDGYGVDAQALRFAEHWEMRYEVCGTAVRPRNGASLRRYTRIVGGDKTAFMLAQASHVICLSTGQIFTRKQEYEPVYATFRKAVAAGLWVTWWSEVTGIGWPVVLDEKPPRPIGIPIMPPFLHPAWANNV